MNIEQKLKMWRKRFKLLAWTNAIGSAWCLGAVYVLNDDRFGWAALGLACFAVIFNNLKVSQHQTSCCDKDH